MRDQSSHSPHRDQSSRSPSPGPRRPCCCRRGGRRGSPRRQPASGPVQARRQSQSAWPWPRWRVGVVGWCAPSAAPARRAPCPPRGRRAWLIGLGGLVACESVAPTGVVESLIERACEMNGIEFRIEKKTFIDRLIRSMWQSNVSSSERHETQRLLRERLDFAFVSHRHASSAHSEPLKPCQL